MQRRFSILDRQLLNAQSLWRFEPFHQSKNLTLPWEESHPALCQWLTALTPLQISEFKSDTALLIRTIVPYIAGLDELQSASSLKQATPNGFELSSSVIAGIPGRKLGQIQSMAEIAVDKHAGTEWLEWCAGKGYLGRLLATQTNQTVTSFEYQGQLCEAGQEIADNHHWPMQFVEGDAFSAEAKNVFNANQHAVALHACGDLHVRLIEHGTDSELQALTISPCCYHLIQAEQYQAMSQLGQSSKLKLSKTELRIPLQQTVTGGARVIRHRQQEMVFRLGFDNITKALGFEEYVPVPSIKKSLLSNGFTWLCEWAAEQKEISLPADINFGIHEEKAIERFWQMERLSLVQSCFQRGLELWLALDKALYLEEQGYDVELSEFCERELTPRNILIHAARKS